MEAPISRNKVVNSLWWKMLERLFTQGINLVVQIILARLLLPEDFGSLAIIVAITNFAAIFVQSGLGTAIVQKADLGEKDVETLFTASLGIALVLYVGLFIGSFWIASYYNSPNLIWPLRIQSLGLFLSAINAIQTALLARKMSFKTLFFRSVLAVPIAGAVGIVMAYRGFGLWALVVHNLTNMFVVVLVMRIGAKIPIKIGFNLDSAKQLYSFSGKILLTNLVSGAGDTIRTMVIGKEYTRQDLSYYDKAYTYSNYVTHIVIGTIQSVILPVFSRSQDNVDIMKAMARRSVGISAFIMFPVLFWVAASSESLVLLLLTDKWASCIPFLMVFCFLRSCGCITTIDKQVYYALGRSDIGLFYEIAFLVINISVLIITVNMGIMAVAIGCLIIELVGTFAIYYVSSRIYGYSLVERIKDLLLPFINSVCVFITCWGITLLNLGNLATLLLQAATGIVVYYIMVRITKDSNCIYLKDIVITTLKNKNFFNNKN